MSWAALGKVVGRTWRSGSFIHSFRVFAFISRATVWILWQSRRTARSAASCKALSFLLIVRQGFVRLVQSP